MTDFGGKLDRWLDPPSPKGEGPCPTCAAHHARTTMREVMRDGLEAHLPAHARGLWLGEAMDVFLVVLEEGVEQELVDHYGNGTAWCPRHAPDPPEEDDDEG